MIDKGPETMGKHREEIAGFLGLSTGKDLHRLRDAHHNLTEVKCTWDQGR